MDPQQIEQLKAIVTAVLAAPGVQIIVGGVFLNVVVAVAAALRRGEFNLAELATFLTKDLAPKILVYYGFLVAGQALDAAWVPAAALALITASLAGRVIAHLAELGIPIPEAVVRLAAGPR